MNRLQLYITTSQAEFQTRIELNADPYVQSWVTDLREAVRQVGVPSGEKAIFYLIKYIDTGVFVVVLRTIPKAPGHHLAAWIYVPYSLQITDADLSQTVGFIADKVAAKEVKPKDIAEMKEIFSRDYNAEPVPAVFPASDGLAYAYRYYGPMTSTTIDDLIGKYRYQPCYLPFAGVLLVDQELTTDVEGTNLTSAPLDPMAVLLPPSITEVDGYTPTIYDQAFDKPYYTPMSRNIDIIWRKDNAADIKQSIYVSQPEMRAPALSLSRPTPVPTHTGQGSKSTSTGVSHTDEPAFVGERKKTYLFQLPAKSAAIGSVIEFEITTTANLTESPIEGYEATAEVHEGSAHSNHLIYSGAKKTKKWLNNAAYAVGGVLVGFLASLAITCGTTHNDQKDETPRPEIVEEVSPAPVPAQAAPEPEAKPEAQAEDPITQQEPAANKTLEDAIRYLDTNQTWEKDEMESFPDLKGLYDDMNNVERHKLVEVWGPKLKESRAFTNQIAHHSRLSYKKTARRIPFNKPSETSIRIQAYLNNIDP